MVKQIVFISFIIGLANLYGQSAFHTLTCGDPIHTYYGQLTDTVGAYPEITFYSNEVPPLGAYGEVSLYTSRNNISMSFGIGKVKVVEVIANKVKVDVRIKKGVITIDGVTINHFHKLGRDIEFEEFTYGFESSGTEKWENGNMKQEGQLRCLKRIGTWKSFYEDGSLESVLNYNDEHELHGTYKEYYPNGSLKTSGSYRNNQQSSSWQTLFEDGKVETFGYYKDGKKVGKWIERNENGKKVKVKY